MKEENKDWKVFEMNDCDWWMARSKKEAIESFKSFHEINSEEELEDFNLIPEDVKEIDEKSLEKLKYFDEDRNFTLSFKEELIDRIKNDPKPQLFATTEF